jgi:hypothetical protein
VGARLVTLVLMRWTQLADVEFRLLVRMAHTALDERSGRTPAATYFGGHELLAATLRSEGGSLTTTLRRVRKAITGLVEAGAVERVGAARSGNNQVYRLTLEAVQRIGPDESVERVQQGSGVPPEEGPQVPAQQGPGVPESRALETLPRNHEEPLEELYEDTSTDDLRTDLTVPRARCLDHPSMLGGERDDGLPRCTFCRRSARTSRPRLQVLQGGAAS